MALEDDVRELAERIGRIERALGIAAAAAAPAAIVPAPNAGPVPLGIAAAAAAAPAAIVPAPNAGPSPRELGRLPQLMGRALLGLAGAYLLRALTEAGTLPAQAGVGAGILYAVWWLVWAARTPAAERIETALQSLTAVLVLCPLLWEAVLRFHAVSTWAAGAILVAFTLFGLAISWRKDNLVLATIATLAGLVTAAGLLIATHDALPFTLVFLAIAAAVEASACLDHWLSERWLAAAAADLPVLLLTWLVTNERGMPATYVPVSHAWLLTTLVLLLAIYLSSTIVRTLARGFTFTFFETAQCAVALAIALSGCLRLSAEDARLAPAAGALAALCAAACYVVAFMLLDRKGAHGRNFYTYSTFGILLAAVGTRILLADAAAPALWLVLAAACMWTGAHYGRFTLQLHGGIFLLLALAGLGVAERAAAALAGNNAVWSGQMQVAAGGALVASAVCYGLCGAGWLRLVLAAALALLAAGTAAAVLTHAYHAVFGVAATHAYCATVRTSLLTAGALLLAWVGARRGRVELSRLVYPAMLLAGWRLIAMDLHEESKAAAMLSLLVYGAALMVLPRVRALSSAPGR